MPLLLIDHTGIMAKKLSLAWCRFERDSAQPVDRLTIERLKHGTLRVRGDWDAESVVCVLLSMARMKVSDLSLLKHMASLFTPTMLQSMRPAWVVAAVWGFTVSGFYNVQHTHVLWERLAHQDVYRYFTAADIALVVWSMGESNVLLSRSLLFHLLCMVPLPTIWANMGSACISHLAHGLAKLGFLTIPMMNTLAQRMLCTEEHSNIKVQDLVDIVWASSQIGLQAPWFTKVCINLIWEFLPTLSHDHSALLLRSRGIFPENAPFTTSSAGKQTKSW